MLSNSKMQLIKIRIFKFTINLIWDPGSNRTGMPDHIDMGHGSRGFFQKKISVGKDWKKSEKIGEDRKKSEKSEKIGKNRKKSEKICNLKLIKFNIK